jgi:hypothetical protein
VPRVSRVRRLVCALTRRRRARAWAHGIRVDHDDGGVRWEAPPRAEFAESRAAAWEEIAGVAPTPDDGFAPEGVTVLLQGATQMDFLPLGATGARELLEAARRRGLVRPLAELQDLMNRARR